MDSKELTKSSIKSVIEAMFANVLEENTQVYKHVKDNENIKEAVSTVKDGDPEGFFYSLIYPLDNFIEGLLSHEIGANDKLQFLFMESQFIDIHFKHIIQVKEDWPCSADKSRSIIKRLAKWLLTGERIEFDYNADVTYHLPKTVFTTHEDIEEFFMALYRLCYGNSRDFVELMNTKYLEKENNNEHNSTVSDESQKESGQKCSC